MTTWTKPSKHTSSFANQTKHTSSFSNQAKTLGFLLKEDAGFLLQENGDRIILDELFPGFINWPRIAKS